MAEAKVQTAFREHVVSTLSAVTESQKAVIDRLDKINGSVGRHEDRIVTLEKIQAATAEGKRITDTWLKYGWGLGGGLLLYALEHIGTLLAPFLK